MSTCVNLRNRIFVYSEKYAAPIGAHVFPIEKYKLIRDRIVAERIASEKQFAEPVELPLEKLYLVHTREYIDDLIHLRPSHRTAFSEVPFNRRLIDSLFLCVGGTYITGLSALINGLGLHIGGGFHHAFPDHAEGFCYLNDVAVALRLLLEEGRASRIAVIDCDLHQGNGTARIFEDEENVFTFSIHQENNYPVKEKSDLDIGLPDGTGDEEYLNHLSNAVPDIINRFKPDMAYYLAGADPYEHDQLGGLKLTIDGLRNRDDYVMRSFRDAGVPLAVVLAGGYAFDTDDTVEIHLNTCKKVVEFL
jgi:acetoin utilization deacetylase AcuC-like enzyme